MVEGEAFPKFISISHHSWRHMHIYSFYFFHLKNSLYIINLCQKKNIMPSKRAYFTNDWQQTCTDELSLHCILVYWGYCQWENWYLRFLCDWFLPVWSVERRCEMVVLGRDPSLSDSEGMVPKSWRFSVDVTDLWIIFCHQTLEISWCNVMSSYLVSYMHQQLQNTEKCKLPIHHQLLLFKNISPPGVAV